MQCKNGLYCFHLEFVKKKNHILFNACFTEHSKSGPKNTSAITSTHHNLFKALYMTSAGQSPCLSY